MLGYMTKEEAKENGFTNHARFFGMPCWFKNESNCLQAKWKPAGFLIDVFCWIHNTICIVMGTEYDFPILLGPEI